MLPAYKITKNNGSSYETSMSASTTLEIATSYFMGMHQVEEDQETGEETLTTVIKVERID